LKYGWSRLWPDARDFVPHVQHATWGWLVSRQARAIWTRPPLARRRGLLVVELDARPPASRAPSRVESCASTAAMATVWPGRLCFEKRHYGLRRHARFARESGTKKGAHGLPQLQSNPRISGRPRRPRRAALVVEPGLPPPLCAMSSHCSDHDDGGD
jgi:hypothetical protein